MREEDVLSRRIETYNRIMKNNKKAAAVV